MTQSLIHRPLRIAYVINSRGIGGAEKLVTALLEGGGRRRAAQVVLNPFAEAASIMQLKEEWKVASLETFECSSFTRLPAARTWLSRRLAHFRPDIIHVLLFQSAVLVASLPRHGEKRLLTHAYGEGLTELPYAGLRRALDGWAARRFDHVSAISNAVKRYLEKRYRLPPPPVGKIVLGWQGEVLPRKQSIARAPTIVCVAALRREKGHDTLVKAFREVRHEIPNARLVLVGGGPHRDWIEAIVRAEGLEGAVEFAGLVPDIWPYLAEADIFALASPMEALGIAVMEAMAAGLPAVVSNTGGLPEFVQDGVTGELVEPRNFRTFAAKLIALMKDPVRRERMSRAAEMASKSLHMNRSVAKYFELYNRIMVVERVRFTSVGSPTRS